MKKFENENNINSNRCMRMIEIRDLNKMYLDDAVALALNEYRQEAEKCKSLIRDNFESRIRYMLKELFENKHGKAAFLDNKLIGYISFFGPWDKVFGNVKGVFSPIGGSAFSGSDRGKLASILFEESSKEMAKEGICTFSLSRYAHDEEVGRSFIMNGFGIRCSDAVMKLRDRHIVDEMNTEIEIIELKGKEKNKIEDLKKGLTRHLSSAPAFYPTDISRFDEWFNDDDIRVIAAKDEENFVGYMAIRDRGGETFIFEHSSMYSICGAYVDENYRGRKVAQQILEYVCHISENEGKAYLGVDCETLNPTALRFWGKYFESYTYSYSRRIDERVIGYDDYLNQCWK
ncbi:MAG: GNAT family N-acetyltransferase [Clostridium sp.]|nr:GNAT family N-acetyltransferase [Clostridium sp.]